MVTEIQFKTKLLVTQEITKIKPPKIKHNHIIRRGMGQLSEAQAQRALNRLKMPCGHIDLSNGGNLRIIEEGYLCTFSLII